MVLVCPFCGNKLDSKDDVPETAENALGNVYICHKVVCYNKDKHPDKNSITVVFKPED